MISEKTCDGTLTHWVFFCLAFAVLAFSSWDRSCTRSLYRHKIIAIWNWKISQELCQSLQIKFTWEHLIRITVFEDGVCWLCLFYLPYCVILKILCTSRILVLCLDFYFSWWQSTSNLCHLGFLHFPARSTHVKWSNSPCIRHLSQESTSSFIHQHLTIFFLAMALAQAGSGLRDC